MIVLAGTIGAGKTTLTKMLSDHLNTPAFYEDVKQNPILPLFYKDPKKYSFLLQVYFLNQRLDEIKSAWVNKKSVMDRSIYEDSLLFHLNADLGRATETEVDIYDSLLKNMMQELPEEKYQKNPDLLIHINISFQTMLERIKMRGRPYEQVDQDPSLYQYYKQLNHRYNAWYQNYDQSPKMEINGDKYDFVSDLNARKTVLKMIDDKLKPIFK